MVPKFKVFISPKYCNGFTGDSTFKCGSLEYISVYKTKRLIRGLFLSPLNPDVIQVGSTIDFEVSYHSGPELVEYAFDYGEGAGKMPANASGMLAKIYNTPGEHLITVHANEFGGESDTVSI
jgi:hypothetical protein